MVFPEFVRIATLGKLNALDTNKMANKEDFESKLIRIFASKLRFAYELVSPADGEFGIQLSGGNWSGMVGMVDRGDADLIIHRLAITEDRVHAIDFTFPYLVNRYTFATTKPELTTDKTSFLLPFSHQVWYCILFYVVVKILSVSVLRSVKFCGTNRRLGFTTVKPQNAAGYLLAYSYGLGDLFLRHSYNVVLLAFLTFPTMTGVRTVSDLSTAVLQGTHQCAGYRGSFIEKYFASSNDSHCKIFMKSLNEYDGPSDAEEALEKSNSVVKFAFFSTESYLLSLGKEYYVSKEPLLYTMTVVGLKKGFCCKASLDSLIHSIWASGIYDKLWNDVKLKVSTRKSENLSSDESISRSLSVGDLEGVFILLFAGNAFAVVVFIFEVVIFMYSKRSK